MQVAHLSELSTHACEHSSSRDNESDGTNGIPAIWNRLSGLLLGGTVPSVRTAYWGAVSRCGSASPLDSMERAALLCKTPNLV